MLPPVLVPSGSISFPIWLSICSGSVPPIEEQITTCVSFPCRRAASIWFFCPIQSTRSGWPLGKPNTGLPVSSFVSPVGEGFAEVPMIIASKGGIFVHSSSSVTSQTITDSGGHPACSKRASRLSGLRTKPRGVNSFGRASILRKAALPVCPPAPLTTTRIAPQFSEATKATIRKRLPTTKEDIILNSRFVSKQKINDCDRMTQ
mmetsp:Transcript_34279/g.50400  ORF Transcript_34279/g.50400 Transcript_34279/m.50400 type:complete len:204 (-) Transcript_34279:5-616(-)